jgi:hypothetical protein
MTDKEENYLSMCVVVKTKCDSDPLAWNGTPAFVTQYSFFNTDLSVLQSLKTAQEQDIKGFTTDKHVKRGDMEDKTMDLVHGLKGFALATSNNILLEEINYTASDLRNDRDENITSKCQIVQDRANTHSLALVDYNITAGMITDQQAAIGIYSAVSQMPSTKEDEKQAITSQIGTTIGKIRDTFKILDEIAKTFKNTNPTFMEEYFNAREIYDLGGGGGETPSE